MANMESGMELGRGMFYSGSGVRIDQEKIV